MSVEAIKDWFFYRVPRFQTMTLCWDPENERGLDREGLRPGEFPIYEVRFFNLFGHPILMTFEQIGIAELTTFD